MARVNRLFAVSILVVPALCATPLHADCPPAWLPAGGPAGLNGPVFAATTWDWDGPGGDPQALT